MHKLQTGYIYVGAPEHPKAHKGFVYEHVLVAENASGKFLPKGAEVHHVDGDPSNNSPNNLVICQDHEYHILLHKRTEALEACGDPSWRKCSHCKEWDSPKNLYINKKSNGKGYDVYHKKCHSEYNRRWWGNA